MGARYLKTEDGVIVMKYPTAPRAEILELIPDRTWEQIGVHARKKGIHRTSKAWGNSVREGRKEINGSWSDEENDGFDSYYPHSTREALLNFFYPRTWFAIQSHAKKRNLHRTREAMSREIKIGRKNAKKKKDDLTAILKIIKEVENDPELREKMEEAQRKYGTLTADDLEKQFTI